MVVQRHGTDDWNPAPVEIANIQVFKRFHLSQLVHCWLSFINSKFQAGETAIFVGPRRATQVCVAWKKAVVAARPLQIGHSQCSSAMVKLERLQICSNDIKLWFIGYVSDIPKWDMIGWRFRAIICEESPFRWSLHKPRDIFEFAHCCHLIPDTTDTQKFPCPTTKGGCKVV